MKKYVKTGMMLCAVLAAGTVLASTTWVHYGQNQAWSNPSNWNNGLPTNQEAVIKGDIAPGAQPIVSATDATAQKVSMYNGASLQIASGATLHNEGVHNAGNSSSSEYSTTTVSGTYTVGAEFALGGWGSGSKGLLVVESGATVNANGAWLIAGHEAGTEGEIVVNGGTLHGGSVVEIGNHGTASLTLNGGSMDATWSLRVAYGTSSSGQVAINGGLLTVRELNVGANGPATIDFNGGRVVANSGGVVQTANATFNFAADGGELVINDGSSLDDVNQMIDNGGGTWNFAASRSVTPTADGIVVKSTSNQGPGTSCLISNGSFEAEPAGTSVSIGSSAVVDTTTFTDWRFFSVGSPPNDFQATLVTSPTDGNVAMRLDLTTNGSGGVDYGLDRIGADEIPVGYGTNYVLSFDAALASGSGYIKASIMEHDSSGNTTGDQQVYYPLGDAGYQHLIMNWTPRSPDASTLYLRFMPVPESGDSISILLDNVCLAPAPPSVDLGSLLQTYDGHPKAASYATTPPGLQVVLTYDGSTNEPVNAGTYTVVGTIDDANYNAAATNTLTIQTSGAYNAWKRSMFPAEEQTIPAISNPEFDPDGDSFGNWQEFIARTDPKDGLSVPSFQAQQTADDTIMLTWQARSNRVYSVYQTPDLAQPFQPTQTNIAWPQSCYTGQMLQATGFYRMDTRIPECFPTEYTNTLGNTGIIGSSHMRPLYYFGTENCLNEGADALLDMGFKVIKIWYYYSDERPNVAYPWNSSWPAGKATLADWLDSTYYTELFDKPFKTFVMNVTSHVGGSNPYYWKDAISQSQIDAEEDEFYEFAKALLQRYEGTGKTFILQHHEGDWHTRGNTDASTPADPGVHERMAEWLNARQRGVTRARKEVCATNVFVYHAAEINLVKNTLTTGQPNMVNEVLPHTDLDLVSYSCYDTCLGPALSGDPEALRRAIQYIKRMMPDSEAFGNDNVYLGEYGIPENGFTEEQVRTVVTNTVTIGLEEKCPYVLFWQLYDNERANDSVTPPVSSNGDCRGFWLIRPDGTESQACGYLQEFLVN